MGSVRALVDDAAAVVSSHSYSPIGVPDSDYGAGFGFTGEPTDWNDLIYLRARYMSPNMGTFLSLDPFEGVQNRPMSLNGYSWVEGNPVMLTDPSGMDFGIGIIIVGVGLILLTTGCNLGPQPTEQPTEGATPTVQTIYVTPTQDPNRPTETATATSTATATNTILPTAAPTDTVIPTDTPVVNATATLPVHTLPPPVNFITPTPIQGASNPYYCFQGSATLNLPSGYACIDTVNDTQEEIIAHILLTEARGALPQTMANVTQVLWNRRGSDSVGGALNPATIVQRASGEGVSSVRDVAFAGALVAVDRQGLAWGEALEYANRLMQAHVSGANQPNYSGLIEPDPRLGSGQFYCAVDQNGVNVLASNNVLLFYEETSPGTFHAYTTSDCGNYLQ